MAWSAQTLLITTALVFLFFSRPAHAFGAGNIASLSKIEGQNWRHGDIEDVLLSLAMARVAGGRKFTKLDVLRVYFGNWLRDYSQAVDVGTVKYVSAEAIRILLWILGFMSFGYGTGEFEVTTERLGCYQPTEHIDNPLGYAEGDDARRYDRRLRGPVDEERELAIDLRTGLKHYIATEDIGIDTSAGFVRRVLGQCIQLGRRYGQSRDKRDLYEALRLLGTGLHCLEDYAAHSNYTELALIELGEQDVFPHVGRNTQIRLPGARHPVYPLVTGTFGGVDFLHSVIGEISDKAAQSELQSLEGVILESQNQKPGESFLQQLLDKIPSEILGGDQDNTGKMDKFEANAQAQKQKREVSPREPEEWTRYLDNVREQLYPVLEWHDNLLKQISQAIEKIPVLPDLIEQVQNEITVFVYSIIAPYVLPILHQVKSELETGSSEIIQSSKQQQHNVFYDDNCTDPTHSMLSKDHFSNVLNEPAGKIAQEVVRWAVPQIMECWDDESIDVDRTLNRIIYGVLHHPVHREYGEDGAHEIRQIMFRVVADWWEEQGDRGRQSLRRQLSREGVRNGENHKAGVSDSGHGCGKPLSLPNKRSKKSSGFGGGFGTQKQSGIGKLAEEAVGGGVLGSIVGGIFEQAGSDLLSGTFAEEEKDKKHKKKSKDYDYEEEEYKRYDDEDEDKKYKKEHKKKKSKDYGAYDEDEDKKYKKEHKKKKSKDYGSHDEDEDKRYKKEHKKKKSKDYGDYDEEIYKNYDDDDEEKKYKKSKGYGVETSSHDYEKRGCDSDGRQTYERSQYLETQYDDGGHRQEGYSRTEYGGTSYERYAERDSYGQQRSSERYGGYESQGIGGGYSSSGYDGYSSYGNQTQGYSQQHLSGGYSKETQGYSGGYSGYSSSGYGRETQGYSGGYSSSGHGREMQGYGESRGYGQEYSRYEDEGYGHRRDRSVSRSREERQYRSSHYGSSKEEYKRYGSEERDEYSYRKRYDDDDDDSDDGRRGHQKYRHQYHRRRGSNDSS
ncbi:hypothetical protein VTO42DRAFT_3519 [Malbranchea cinnamomea]